MKVQGIPLPVNSENIVHRAWQLLAHRAPADFPGLEIILEKNIPVGAGLGGGSSDAAATLLALDRFWRLEMEHSELADLALELGSDVPFFLRGGTAVGRGRGEKLETLSPLSQGAFLLVNPGFAVSTEWVFGQIRLGLTRNPYRINLEQVKPFLARFPAPGMVLKNRLEDVVFPSYPQMEEIEEKLREAGAVHVAMTGSGATVFGTFSDDAEAGKAREDLGDRWWSRVARPFPSGVRLELA